MMSEPKRLHPAAMILNLFHIIVQTIKNIILPFFFVFVVNSNHAIRFYGSIALGILFIWLIAASIIKWRKFTYRIEADEVRIEEGLFFTKKRYISMERIQSMNTSAGLIQQIFKLVKLQIETAGGGKDAEAVLSAISLEEAERIKRAVFTQKEKIKDIDMGEEGPVMKEDEAPEAEKIHARYQMGIKELLAAASTSGGIGVIISAVIALLSQIDEFLPMDWFYDKFSFLKSASIGMYAVLVFICLFIAWLLSIAGMMIKYANFQIEKKEHELVISRGIIEKHQVTIPLRKIQAIKIKENIIRELLGFVTVTIVSAGGGDNEKEGASTILFPVIQKKKLAGILRTFTPEYTFEAKSHHLPKRALRRYLFRSTIFSIVLIIPLCIFFQPWGYFSLILLPIELVFGYLAYRDSSWHINGEKLQLTTRFVGKNTAIILRRRMQIYKVSQSYFQTKKQLSTISTSVKSSSNMEELTVKDIEAGDAQHIFRWYSYEKADG